MKLITKEIEKRLQAHPIKSTETKKEDDIQVLVKFFTPWSSWTWFVTEAEWLEDQKTWEFFGLVVGHEVELGYFWLSELEGVTGPFGLKIERDMHFDPKTTLAEVRKNLKR